MDWLDLHAVQGTLKSLLQHHSSKASILQCSVFFTVQLSYPYMTNGKTIALTRQTFLGKVMSLLFDMLSRLVIAFLPKSLLISWLQSTSAMILEPKKIKPVTVSIVCPCISHEAMRPDAMIFSFWMLSFQPAFSLSSFIFIKRLFRSFSLSAIRVMSSAYLRYWHQLYFSEKKNNGRIGRSWVYLLPWTHQTTTSHRTTICVNDCMCVCPVAQVCPTLCNPMDRSLPLSSVHGILQARILE